jgi:hypothetical protein
MNKLSRHILISALTALLLFSISCTGRKEKAEKQGIIPEDDFVNILADIHIADGLLIIPKIRDLYQHRDSIENYMDVIESHGYTKEELDKTIRYYFVKKPRKLQRIYDEILAKLSELESKYANESITESNYWKGDSAYFMPGGSDTLLFDQQFESFGYYTINFTLTLFPDDNSVNPHFVGYFCHPDSIETGRREFYPSFIFLKDGRPHTYSFFRKPSSTSFTHLRGWFVYPENSISAAERHLSISNIRVNFLPAAR